ncbi:MAG TPA: ABC transporter permease [Candidatus Acutalibacter pullicola]|uniref:ABC transporter permease n=1 Tax=Candidatus Acutalibacter pullicola TaxID=2838417 RepID=A0A9D2MXK7_9FIRM|nr:ABC transporter permease [Candidatus Acutalibacter pullicola]
MALAKYFLKRIAYGVVTLFVLVSLTFFMQQLLPGDPFIGDKNLPEATMEALYAKYGLDKPVWMQYFIYLGNCLHGDLGVSLQNHREITTIIAESFVVSFDVGVRAVIFAFVLGVLLGTVAAIKRGSAVDTICMFVALVGVSVPSFIVASILQYFLGMKLTMALGDPVFATTGWDEWNSKILPVFALGFGSLAQISRLTRTSMLDVLSQDYIKTAKAKGLSQPAIIWKHALRNSIMPVVTVLGPITAGVLTGGFVVENIFSIPGMGRYFVQSIQNRDYTLISGTTIFYGAFLIVANLVVDLVYGLIDPRVKLEEG